MLKNDEDVFMLDAEDFDLSKTLSEADNKNMFEGSDDADVSEKGSRVPPISSRIVTAQASPLKRFSKPIDGKVGTAPPSNLFGYGLATRTLSKEQDARLECKTRNGNLSVPLNSVLAPGKPVVSGQVLPRTLLPKVLILELVQAALSLNLILPKLRKECKTSVACSWWMLFEMRSRINLRAIASRNKLTWVRVLVRKLMCPLISLATAKVQLMKMLVLTCNNRLLMQLKSGILNLIKDPSGKT